MRIGTAIVAFLLSFGACSTHHQTETPDATVAIVNNALRTCQRSGMIRCHAEIDSDGSVSVYGERP